MRKIAILLVFLLFAGLQVVLAQKTISGKVTSSADGLGVPGATVLVKGTNQGTITDMNGAFKLTVPANATTLVVSVVGMKKQELEIGTATTLNVVMEMSVLNLDEVIVIGYGTQKREAKTGSVGVVSSDRLKNIPETSIDKMLSGKVSGVQVTSTSGQPGSNSEIRIRGISSILAGTEPLYVIDGIAVMSGDQSFYTNTGNALASLNPNDVDAITILKDAAASSIYGSRAANGVILITTKSGKAGATKTNFRTSYGFEQLSNDRNYRPLNGKEFLTLTRQSVVNAGGNPDDATNSKYYFPLSLLDSTQTDWLNAVTRIGRIYNAELSMEGGNEKT
jgi:TonB-dependent starch-binding outer membrane protein SusC